MRLFRFLKLWFESLVVGDSWAGTVLRVAGFAGSVLIVVSATWFDMVRSYWITYGWGLLVAYIFWMGGHAWVRSTGPVLWVADTPLFDTEPAIYRCRIKNKGDGILTPKAELSWIEVNGTAEHVARMPLELGWVNFPQLERPHLSWSEEASFDICYHEPRGLQLRPQRVRVGPPPPGGAAVPDKVIFAGEFYTPFVPTQPTATGLRPLISFGLRVSVSGTRRFVKRAFSLEPDGGQPHGYRLVRLQNRERHKVARWRRRGGPT
jgi:hypothetical protein